MSNPLRCDSGIDSDVDLIRRVERRDDPGDERREGR